MCHKLYDVIGIFFGILFSVKTVLNCKLCENGNGKLVSVLDLPGNMLIIPQATLGGRLKSKCMQYHTNIEKEIGKELYSQFVKQCEATFQENMSCSENGVSVESGTYGNRQVLSVVTNGPFTHIVEM